MIHELLPPLFPFNKPALPTRHIRGIKDTTQNGWNAVASVPASRRSAAQPVRYDFGFAELFKGLSDKKSVHLVRLLR